MQEGVLVSHGVSFLIPLSAMASTPSIKDGLDPAEEANLRAHGAAFAQELGVVLGLPMSTVAKALTLLHRFYYCRSLVDYDVRETAQAAVLLASKLEDRERKVDDVVNIARVIETEWQLINTPETAPTLLADDLEDGTPPPGTPLG
eukprot:Sspe_Gene.93065::Locus_65776_Transcript_1_1_Confidence_1.000_Length_578::g.93065::m.93065